MSISSIQKAQRQYEIFPAQRLGTYTEENTSSSYGAGSGTDTVSLSPGARALAAKSASAKAEGENTESALQQATQNAAASASRALPEIDKGKMLSMMMEMLFISEQGERGQGSGIDAEGNPVQEQPAKPANPFQDNAQTASLKKVMNDFMSGKADISDLPAAMAGGKSAAAGAKQTNTSSSPVIENSDSLFI